MALVCLTVFSSCSAKEGPADENADAVVYTVKLPASTTGGKAVWQPGDQFIVHGEYSKDQLSVILSDEDISDDGQTCSVKVSGVDPYEQKVVKARYYIAYPGDMVANESHCKDISGFTGTNALLLAGYNKGKTFVLESLVGGFSFTVGGDFDSYDFKGNSDETVGYTSLSCRITESASLYAHSKGSAVTTIQGDVKADGKSVNHICFSGNFSLADGFQMTFYKNGTPVKTFYTTDSYEVTRNVFVSLGDITSRLQDYKAPVADSHASSIPTDGAADLGAAGTANCYIVERPGTYAFKAVKGNTSEGLASIGSAEILWESWGNVEEVIPNSVIAQVDFEKNMVYFRVAEGHHPGNAVIAVKNDMGTIMWSWHIWVPETPVKEGLYGLSRHMTMDRNLGALDVAFVNGASPESAGLFYQWGRKDPFVGVGDFATGKPASVAGQAMTLAGGQMTTAKSLKNPTVFADNHDGHWNTASHEDYWADSKTQYDPCPPGYKVPDRYENLLFIDSPAYVAGWGYSPSDNVFTAGKPQAVYPLGGYITTDGKYSQYGEGTRMWSSYSSSTVSSAYNFRIFESEGAPSYGNGSKPKSNGFAVRCVSVKETPFENAPGTPVQGKQHRFSVNVQELSGLCLHTDKSFLWGVGDQGSLVKIDFNGKAETHLTATMDAEGVTVDPATGDLYIGCEQNYVFKVEAPEYKGIKEAFRVADAVDYGNSGVEGISWYKDGLILVGAQTGADMWAYRPDGTLVWKKSMRSVAIGMKEIADICYDPVKDQIWIIDSETQSIYLFNGDATEHLATYNVSFGGNCESVHVDYANSCVWIADDDSPSKLYKIEYTF